jgi:hypothetical protein
VAKIGDVPTPDLIGAGGGQWRGAHARGCLGLAASGELIGGPQHPVEGRFRGQVASLIGQRRDHLVRGQGKSVIAAQDALRDSKSPQRPLDETTCWPGSPHIRARLRFFATPLSDMVRRRVGCACIAPTRLRAFTPAPLRRYTRALRLPGTNGLAFCASLAGSDGNAFATSLTACSTPSPYDSCDREGLSSY